jgi:hypothetical protein
MKTPQDDRLIMVLAGDHNLYRLWLDKERDAGRITEPGRVCYVSTPGQVFGIDPATVRIVRTTGYTRSAAWRSEFHRRRLLHRCPETEHDPIYPDDPYE